MVQQGSSHTVLWLLRCAGAITHDVFRHKTKNLVAYATSWSLTLSPVTVHQCHVWVEFELSLVLVLALLGLQEIYCGYSSFPEHSYQKPTFPDSNSTWIEERQENHPGLVWLPL